jgi:tetratricopeptide (TPR) repeat protein
MKRIALFAWTLILLVGCATGRQGPATGLSGPKHETLPIYRSPGVGDKIFVEARLQDGSIGVFLVDTGSSMTVISQQVALSLNLSLEPRASRLVGLGGPTSWTGSRLTSLKLGRFAIRDIPVAVGVTGVPTKVGMVPLAGIIGNDVLGQFQLIVDYPAQMLELYRPGEFVPPATASALFFNGDHAMVKTTITARDSSGVTVEQPVLLDVDTGARTILLRGGTNTRLADVTSEGAEPIGGIGSTALTRRSTRRVPIVNVPLGGIDVERPLSAIWLDHDAPLRRHTPDMPGLLGYAALKEHRVVLDYPGKQFALLPTAGEAPPKDVHEWFLARARPSPLDTAKTLLVLGRIDEAERRLTGLAKEPTKHSEAAILLARMMRSQGELDNASSLLQQVPMQPLATSGEIIALVNGLWLSGNSAKALQSARLATTLEPSASAAWVSLADVQLSLGKTEEARKALSEAIAVLGDPNQFRLRRSIVASLESDVDGAMTHLRRMIRAQPSNGYAQWLYARMANSDERKALVAHDLDVAQRLVHPAQFPYDFAAGAWALLDGPALSDELLGQGLARDCDRARTAPSRDNCMAWYQSLVDAQLEESEALVRGALETHPQRSEFLDTLAMVLEAQGQISEAKNASWLAALHQPDDPYLVVQALRYANEAQPEN